MIISWFILLIFIYIFMVVFNINTSVASLFAKISKGLSFIFGPFKWIYHLASKLNIKNRTKELKYALIGSLAVHIVILVISAFSGLKENKTEQNWVVHLAPSQEEELQIQVSESAPPLEEGDSLEGGSEGENISNPIDNMPSVTINEPILQTSMPTATFTPKVSYKNINSSLFKNGGNGNGRGFGIGDGKGNGRGTSGKIMGDTINAVKLGVILDVSPSMKPYIPMLQNEIMSNFKSAKILNVVGCSLIEGSRSMSAFEDLSTSGVDAIYWFCDLQDPQIKASLDRLESILKKNNIKLYIKSLDMRPNVYLSDIIVSSGGKFLTN
jgi:hypothetical protein